MKKDHVLVKHINADKHNTNAPKFEITCDQKTSWALTVGSAIFFAKRIGGDGQVPIYFKESIDDQAQLLDDALELMLFLKYGKE